MLVSLWQAEGNSTVTHRHALLSNARFTLADPTPRCCRLGQCKWVPDPESAVGASSGDHQEVVGSRTCAMQLRLVINKTLSPYNSGSRTILYDSLAPTDATVRIRPM